MLFAVSLFTTETPSEEIIDERIEFDELSHVVRPKRCRIWLNAEATPLRLVETIE